MLSQQMKIGTRLVVHSMLILPDKQLQPSLMKRTQKVRVCLHAQGAFCEG